MRATITWRYSHDHRDGDLSRSAARPLTTAETRSPPFPAPPSSTCTWTPRRSTLPPRPTSTPSARRSATSPTTSPTFAEHFDAGRVDLDGKSPDPGRRAHRPSRPRRRPRRLPRLAVPARRRLGRVPSRPRRRPRQPTVADHARRRRGEATRRYRGDTLILEMASTTIRGGSRQSSDRCGSGTGCRGCSRRGRRSGRSLPASASSPPSVGSTAPRCAHGYRGTQPVQGHAEE